jgi:hypothetical protein
MRDPLIETLQVGDEFGDENSAIAFRLRAFSTRTSSCNRAELLCQILAETINDYFAFC